MNSSRRIFLATSGIWAAPRLAAQPAAGAKAVRVMGVACSPRKGRTTAAAVQAALEAARATGVETEFIDLGGLKMQGALAAGLPLGEGERDDFPAVEARMRAPEVAGIIVGTPVYFTNMSALAKEFLDRWMVFRKDFALRDKVGGAIAVGAARNGGQEVTLQNIHAAMLCQDMILVSDGRPTARLGGILVSAGDDIMNDELGLSTARGVGRRVAEVALRLRQAGAGQ